MEIVALLVIALSAWLVDSAITGRAPITALKEIIGGSSLSQADSAKLPAIPVSTVSPDSDAAIDDSDKGANVTVTSGTYSGWFSSLLNGLSITPTAGNLSALADVVQVEGKNSYNNPFNITWKPGESTAWKGSGTFNSAGVQEYATPADGLKATIAFLTMNPSYKTFLSALASGSRTAVQNAFIYEYSRWGAVFHTSSQTTESKVLASVMGG